ncbi:hypothetical protein [Spirochaeta cellobiosiphila]|uniref:hypothetical protein n=1 Tax=Spirochaeta cellobiosiphila TaxID=504483 RepID=UPI00049013F1|nr:hypothetical protein [Spirochaeta cellobiosiphila]
MIFISFVLISSLYLLSAYFCGDVGYFINVDSIIIIFIGLAIFTLGLKDYQSFILGIKDIFSFKKKNDNSKNINVARYYLSLSLITPIIGLCSTFQGIYCGIFGESGFNLTQTFCIAGFTTVYGIIISAFLFYPVYHCNKT